MNSALPPFTSEVRPKIDELLKVQDVKCPAAGCGKIFTQASAMRLHRIKVHKLLENEDDAALYHRQKHHKSSTCDEKFFCPETNCKFHSTHHFKKFKYVKQHYMKVHAEKKFICECGKSYGLLVSLKSHQATCGKIYYCTDCNTPYTTINALRNHCVSKNHSLPSDVCSLKDDKTKSYSSTERHRAESFNQIGIDCSGRKYRRLLKKPVTGFSNISVQTDIEYRSIHTQTPVSRCRRSDKAVQKTEEVKTRRTKKSKHKSTTRYVDTLPAAIIETRPATQTYCVDDDFMNSETQTTMALLEELAQTIATQTPRSFFAMNDETATNFETIETQTPLPGIHTLTSPTPPASCSYSDIGIGTCMFAALEQSTDGWNNDWVSTWNTNHQQTSTDNSSIHTQTQTIDSMFDQILSHMETQTNDSDPFPGFPCINTYTQTCLANNVDFSTFSSSRQTQTPVPPRMQTAVPPRIQTPVPPRIQTPVQSTTIQTQTMFHPHHLDLTESLTDSHTQTTFTDLEMLISNLENSTQ
ncbi:uncharacterized protein LOC141900702 [Tubulanus polymorphus]|uniref:uncharacterized protein LOC141900702 n=1 Tax=Tubulanus polymorphus TaxID=672921 RepID=UPI003DA33F26